MVIAICVALIAACSGGGDENTGPLATSAPVAVNTAGSAPADPTTTASSDPLPAVDARDEWGDPVEAAPVLPADKQQIIDGLDPAAPCMDDSVPAALVPRDGERVLQVVRAVGECIIIESVVVPAGELEQRAADAIAESDVVSAGEATTAYNDSEQFESLPDPQVGQQQWWLDDLRVSGLDDLTVDPATPKVRVAVIDTGIDDTNPDLAGLVADRAPWAEAPGAGQSSHGTHVAGIIAAIANNGTEGRGIARNVEFLDINTTGPSVAEMIDWATDHGADVINMSFCEVGSTGKLPCRDTPSGATIGALAWAAHKGVLMFASAGNCGPGVDFGSNAKAKLQCDSVHNRVTYPGAYARVISVGAYGRDGKVTGFSTQNDYVDVSAPGSDILSTVLGGTTGSMSGTSQASPMVAGSAAALLAHRPDINPGRVLSGLFAIVRDAGSSGWDRAYGNGKIDPLTVAQRIDAGTPAPPVSPVFETDGRDPYVVSNINLAARTIALAPWSEGPGTAVTVRLSDDFRVLEALGQEVSLLSFATFVNANQGVEIPELVSVIAGDGTVSAIHPYTGDGDGEGIDFDYCWVAGYAEVGLGGEIVSCPADPRPGVTILQQDLNRLGYGPVAVDGHVGAQTLAALAAVRAQAGLDETGRADGSTIFELKVQLANRGGVDCMANAGDYSFALASMHAVVQVGAAVCDGEWLLAAYTVDEAFDNPAGGPDLSPAVALFRSLDGSQVLINWWERVDEGQAVSRYSQDALVGEGVPVAVAARLMADLSASG